mgnify:CR=1 FL=1
MIFDTSSTSFRDGLSGLYSEAYFAEVFQREWNRMLREQAALSVIIIHPHLNVENENDQLSFKLIADAIEGSTKRSTDLACRFHSDEIAVGLFNLDKEGTEVIVNRIITTIEPQLSELINNVDLSIGALNVQAATNINIDDIFIRAEQLADLAERKGKNSFEIDYLH